MNKLFLLGVIFSVGAVGAAEEVAPLSLNWDYFGPESEESLNQPRGQELLKAIEVLPEGKNPKDVHAKLTYAAKQRSYLPWRIAYEVLLNMASWDKRRNRQRLVDYYLMVKKHYADMTVSDPMRSKVKTMVDYVDWNVIHGFFNLLLVESSAEVRNKMKEVREYTEKLDEFVCTAYDLKGADDEKLHQAAKN